MALQQVEWQEKWLGRITMEKVGTGYNDDEVEKAVQVFFNGNFSVSFFQATNKTKHNFYRLNLIFWIAKVLFFLCMTVHLKVIMCR